MTRSTDGPGMKKKLVSLQVLRALAALMVTHSIFLGMSGKQWSICPFDSTATALVLLLLFACPLGITVYYLIERPINRFFHVQRLRVPVPASTLETGVSAADAGRASTRRQLTASFVHTT